MLKPLAERVRPHRLDQFRGQEHLVAEGKLLQRMIATKRIASMIFWGPPGTGKTTLAQIIAEQMNLPFFKLSAINAGVKEVRQIIEEATQHGKAVLFLDEIHRFNKSQQDSLLGAVENGSIILIGATTENPSFEVNKALLSRAQVYVLKELSEQDLLGILHQALEEDEILKTRKIELIEQDALFSLSSGDARKMLNLLELVVEYSKEDPIRITNAAVMEVAQQKITQYDKSGESHYDTISAFIKSIRGSDPNAALYYLAKMMLAGEDPSFIARRLLILASEDIGNANPNALLMANTCFQSVNVIGYPECELILTQTVIYLACSEKSNSVVLSLMAAKNSIRDKADLPVPLALRNAPSWLMKKLDYGKEYKYAHDYPGNFVEQEFLPKEVEGSVFYQPQANSREKQMRDYLRRCWAKKYNY